VYVCVCVCVCVCVKFLFREFTRKTFKNRIAWKAINRESLNITQKERFAEMSKNLASYRSENNLLTIKIIM